MVGSAAIKVTFPFRPSITTEVLLEFLMIWNVSLCYEHDAENYQTIGLFDSLTEYVAFLCFINLASLHSVSVEYRCKSHWLEPAMAL